MKKEALVILAVFIAVTFPAYSALLRPGMLTSHDGEGHIIRMFEFNNAIEDGHFPVRWSKRLNWGLGYPFFNFNYPLPYYTSYLMHKAGLGLLDAFKIILAISFPLSGFFTFLWLKNHFSKIESIIGGLFYTLIPYHFVNVYVRGNLGETLALTIVPLNFYLVNRLNKKLNLNNVILLGLCLSAVILSHNISALLFLPVILIYGLLLNFRKGYLKLLIYAFILPVVITCFFWLPALFDKQFITIDQKFPLYYLKHFPDLKDLIYSAWGYGGSKVGPGQMSVQIGLLHLMIFIGSLFALIISFKKITQKKMAVFFLGLAFLAFLLMLEVSKPVWDTVKPVQYLQFPWRLLAVLALAISFLAGFTLSLVFKIVSKKISLLVLIVITFALLFLNRNHWRANEYYQLPDYWFEDKPYNSTTTVDGEHTPKWQLEDMPLETARFEVVSGKAEVKSFEWKTNYHVFEIDSQTNSIILDRTVYFPGWAVYIDGKEVEHIDQNDPKTKGLIGFEVSEGKHFAEVKLMEPSLNKVANTISMLGLLFVLYVKINSCRSLLRNLSKVKKFL